MISCNSQAKVRLQVCLRDYVQLWRKKAIRFSRFRSAFQRCRKRERMRKKRRRRVNMKLSHKKSMELCMRMSASFLITTQKFSPHSQWTLEIAILSRSTKTQLWVSSLAKNRHIYPIRPPCGKNRANWLSESCKNLLKEQDILRTKVTCKCLHWSQVKASKRFMRQSYKTSVKKPNPKRRASETKWSKISKWLSMSKGRKRI